jgi:hypothetical protein
MFHLQQKQCNGFPDLAYFLSGEALKEGWGRVETIPTPSLYTNTGIVPKLYGNKPSGDIVLSY